MSLHPNQQKQIMDILILSLEGEAGEKDIQTLREILNASSEAREYYLKAVIAAECIRKMDWQAEDVDAEADRHECLSATLWKALSDEEKGAPAIEIAPPEEPRILIQKVQHQKIVRKISKSILFTLCTAAAAILLIFAFAYFTPTATGVKVAVLSDCIDAEWADTELVIDKGSPVFTSFEKLILRQGYVKLLFDNHAQVTIEGPAEFQILAEDKMNVRYGRLYAIVPPEAIGFMVATQNAKIIDLGTEFGVEVNPYGDTSLHVMKGKTTMIAGEKTNKQSIDVIAGIAKKVSAVSQTVSDISCDERLFARNIDSASEMIWRGEVQPMNGYINWTAESGNWSEGRNWDAGIKPDGTQGIQLRKGSSSVCTIKTSEKPVDSQLTVSNGQTLNIETGGYVGFGWSRFGKSTVNMTGNGTWLLNDDDLYLGYPAKDNGKCIWTMSDTSTITINEDADNEETLYISQDYTKGTLKLIGSRVTVNCDQLYIGYPRNPGFSPEATLEYVMDAGGVSTIHVGYRLHLSTETATSHLVLAASELPPGGNMVLIDIKSSEKIAGDAVFDTVNGGPATEGTSITLGGNHYVLTYQYEADGDGFQNDIALVFKENAP